MKISLQLLICVLFFSFGITKAQNLGQISGKAIAPNEQTKKGILVKLLLAKDRSLVKTQSTDSNGSFVFENLIMDNYFVVIDNLSFNKFQSKLITIDKQQSEIILPTIVLEAIGIKQLNEVVIQKKKPLVTQKIDRTVVNVDALISTAGGNAMEVLEKSPGISVNSDGTITFKGKSGVTVFVDDKPTYLSGSDLEAYLKSLPASTLDKIELISNPPAKYDAAGGAGIINILTRKSKIKGFNGNLTTRVAQGKRGQTREGLNLNYLNNKVRLYGNIGYATQDHITDLYIFRKFKKEDLTTKNIFDQYSQLDGVSQTTNSKLGLDYYITPKSTFGIGLTGIYRSNNNTSKVRSAFSDAGFVLDSTIIAKNLERSKFKNAGINLNYRHDLDTIGQKITVDLDYLNYDKNTNQRFNNFIYQPDNSLSSQDELKGALPVKISIYSLKADYSLPLKHSGLLETGYKSSYTKTNNTADYRDVINENEIPNYNTSNHFKYDEVINAVYLNFNTDYRRFTFQTGLRLENTESKGNQLGNILKPASEFKKNYTNLFPTLFVQYKLDSVGDNQLVANYGKRINRPNYQDLNPFISPLDKYTYYAGNPYLNPSFSDNYELSYRFKGLFSTTLTYANQKNEIEETIEINDGIYYSRPGNIGKNQIYSINLNADIPFNKWWSSNVYTELTTLNSQSKLYSEDLNSSGTFWLFTTINSLKLKKNWSAEISAGYQTKITQNQFEIAGKSYVNFAIQKKILKEKGNLKLAVNDIFYGSSTYGQINNLKLTDAKWTNIPDSRFVALTFTYGFGKTFKNKSEHNPTGADSEKNRAIL
ncbi:outer membrane beta-barrel family protein [Flavobacterium soyangense]|uniref:TonB-dependent receptor n=1 Tax=Flavobacterium soyangense TaxID=2023265 RepID=A0A930UDQ8_9FLAO|nr:outer membrane beta-barrel family protein [Flavobacterium soyangense]MBF2709451.1 TonB-dependent receptor [Flavobacterium soyangense]